LKKGVKGVGERGAGATGGEGGHDGGLPEGFFEGVVGGFADGEEAHAGVDLGEIEAGTVAFADAVEIADSRFEEVESGLILAGEEEVEADGGGGGAVVGV
jgi:hypothetical protein